MDYCQLEKTTSLPEITGNSPFKAVLIADTTATPEQKETVANWLARSGCLYLMAWGLNCRSWQDAVNLANLKAFDFGTIPDKNLIITTAHGHEELEDVFWFAKYTAMHPCFELDKTLLVHWSHQQQEQELKKLFAAA